MSLAMNDPAEESSYICRGKTGSVGHQGKAARGVSGEKPAKLGTSAVFCEKGTAMLSETYVHAYGRSLASLVRKLCGRETALYQCVG